MEARWRSFSLRLRLRLRLLQSLQGLAPGTDSSKRALGPNSPRTPDRHGDEGLGSGQGSRQGKPGKARKSQDRAEGPSEERKRVPGASVSCCMYLLWPVGGGSGPVAAHGGKHLISVFYPHAARTAARNAFRSRKRGHRLSGQRRCLPPDWPDRCAGGCTWVSAITNLKLWRRRVERDRLPRLTWTLAASPTPLLSLAAP